ncbi:MAG: Rid family detoxifying hydrolase [Chlamydiota bacterium]
MSTEEIPQALGPYSLSVSAGPFLFLSGQTPIDPQTGALVGLTIEEQTHQVIDNIEAILAKEGLTLEHVVRCDVFLKEMSDFSRMNAAYAERFSQSLKPTRTTVEVSRLPLDARVEITCIACLEKPSKI